MFEAEPRQKSIIDSIIDFAIIVTDRDGVVTDWNTGAQHVFSWSAAELPGPRIEPIFTAEDRASGHAAAEREAALANGRALDERWHVRKDGSRFWSSGEIMPLRSEADEHLGFVKVLRDRTKGHLAR